MARVTVEDCIDKVPNRFELVLLAAHRARSISAGSPITVERDNDKNPVVALREIAELTVSPDDLKEELINSLQKKADMDEPEAEAKPRIASHSGMPLLGQDDPSKDTVMDTLTEDQVLRGMESSAPSEGVAGGSRPR